MSSCLRDILVALVCASSGAAFAQRQPQQTASAEARYPGIGRAATQTEIAAWDIDVRPDFLGLPKGSGTVDQGLEIWESKCAACHGVFGESNQFFSPLAGGTTEDDIASGRVARLNDRGFPARTTLMKLSTVSTLWDYIHRAMPWNAPKSLSVDEVYAVTAYLLNLGDVVPNGFELSDRNIGEVQKLIPNRNGMTTGHALWPGAAFGNEPPDVQAAACMQDCVAGDPKIASELPDFARNANGNLADQNRLVGAQLGADTSRPPPATLAESAAARSTAAASAAMAGASTAGRAARAAAVVLTEENGCVACHALDGKRIGPAFLDVARRYAQRTNAAAYLGGRIRSGGVGVWGQVPMPAQTLSEADAAAIAAWLARGAPP